MKLRYKNEFVIRDDSEMDTTEVMEEFRNRHLDKMELYQSLKDQELKIVHKRRGMLKDIKLEFDKFAKEEYPERFL